MSRITVQCHVTLDGLIESPPEALLPYMSDEGRQATLELALAVDALLLGRVTWERLAPVWREQSGPFAERLNAMPKYVVTSTLTAFDAWPHSRGVRYADVAALREQHDLLVYGCGALARDLLRDELLDEMHLNMTPVVAGRGRRLFDEPSDLLALDLVSTHPYPTGALRLVLRPSPGPEAHGSAGGS
ncbi:dihydrofolate reductase family protein [Motilibacter aurantiacus]|uniref:dihydrofolate reductase family protein n=1 Tax=Motilibacter aurantiacus TaxID=2714955 RepID=UPI0014083253|nr:dihydrofolate reductase family protein [Motilibacter aurantiacus]NHC45339.1 dihydrofolate reductase [Motilibacter aurantiacus]